MHCRTHLILSHRNARKIDFDNWSAKQTFNLICRITVSMCHIVSGFKQFAILLSTHWVKRLRAEAERWMGRVGSNKFNKKIAIRLTFNCFSTWVPCYEGSSLEIQLVYASWALRNSLKTSNFRYFLYYSALGHVEQEEEKLGKKPVPGVPIIN